MADAYQSSVPFVNDGEAVNAAVTNRPTRVLAQNEQYLRDRLDAAALGEANIAYGVTVAPSVLPGMPVAFDTVAQQYVPALATVKALPQVGTLAPSPLSQVVGLVIGKESANQADLLISGRFAMSLTTDTGQAATPGMYYLSATLAGGLTQEQPPMAVPVLFYDGTYAYFATTFRNPVEDHVHFHFDLVCAPAGDNLTADGVQSVPDPDATKPGWLPASHPIFTGLAPSGAVFGYNMAQDPNLSEVWPPVPLSSLCLFWDKGDGSALGAQLIPGGADPSNIAGLWYADRTTIWWLSNCDHDVPWVDTYNPASPPAPLAPPTVPPTCPRPTAMRLVAFFAQMLFQTGKNVVTSLSVAPGAPLAITSTPPGANSGDLTINLDLSLAVSPTPVSGPLVFKNLNGVTFQRGYVVETLVPGANVTLTPTVGTGTAAQGTVRIDVATDLAGREIEPTIAGLLAAKERNLNGLLYTGLAATGAAGVRMRFELPSVGLPADPVVNIRIWLLGDATGSLPAMTMSYRQLSRPGTGSAVTPPASDTALPINTNVAITAGQYLEFLSDPITINPGDTLFVSLNRLANDGYSGEVGLLRAAAVVNGAG